MSSAAGDQWQVIVAGAGPCGLIVALSLARKGIRVLVLDAASDVDSSPRATAFQPCAIAEMIELGIYEDVLAVCVPDATISWWKARTDSTEHTHLVTITTQDGLQGDSENALAGINMGQDVLSRILLRHLKQLDNAKVIWRHSVVAVTQTEHCVTVTYRATTSHGISQRVDIQVDWIVGADGGRSTIRKLSGVGFEGFTWPKEEFVATNVYYPFERYGFTARNFVIDGVNWAIVAKINKEGLWRVAFGVPPGRTDDEIKASLQEHYKYILPGSATGWKLERLSKYKPHQKCVTSMRIGRILLAGDAAHLNNPIGGLGLSTGILDAGPLARALASIILCSAPTSLLDVWERSRRDTWWSATNEQSIEFKRIAQQGGYGNDPTGIWAHDKVAQESGMLQYLQGATPDAKARDEALYTALADKLKQQASRARVWRLALPADWMKEHEDPQAVQWRQSFRPVEV